MKLEDFAVGEHIGFKYLQESRDMQLGPRGFYGRINSIGKTLALNGRELVLPALNLMVNPEGNINMGAYELKDKLYVLRKEDEETLEAELIRNPMDLILSLEDCDPEESLLLRLIEVAFPVRPGSDYHI